MYKALTQKSGFTLVEVIIVSAISVLIFGAMFASFQYSLRLINLSRSKLSAISVANDRMEYFRSLPYNNVGTIAGIPPGTIPQNSVISLNGIEFNERVLVEYVDDPADGLNVADTNGIPSDYKRVKVEYTWEINGVNGQIALISNIVPRSIETTAGGGTVRINVIDDQSNLLPGARVRLTNASSTSPIDVTKITDVNGEALFSGTPVDSNYEVSVTGPIAGKAYSVDKTYEATTTNPNPSLSPFSVLESDISTLTFQIGELSDINLALKSSVTDGRFVEDFTSLAGVASSSDVVSNGNELVLSDVAGVYDIYGEVYLEVIPTAIEAWQAVRVAANVPTDTDYKVYFYTGAGAGPYTIIPDTDLPGNSGGFADSIIDISNLSPTLYPSLVVGVVLETSDVSVTPIIDEVGVYYREAETLMTNQSMGVRGSKIIGTDATANFIYKYDVSTTTDVNGERLLGAVEFDEYHVSVAGYKVAQGCGTYPFIHQAGVDGDLEVIVTPAVDNTLRVKITDVIGRSIPGIEAVLTRSGYNQTRYTGACGQVYFPGFTSPQTDFVLNISAPGYQPQTFTDVNIDGDVQLNVTLNSV